MKSILSSIVLFISLGVSSQTIYKTSKSEEFKSIISDGVNFVLTGDDEKDSLFIRALEEYWTVSDYKIVDPEVDELGSEDIAFFEASFGATALGDQHVMGLIHSKYLKHGQDISFTTPIIYNGTFGYYMSSNDFPKTRQRLVNMIIIGLNDVLTFINDESVTGSGVKVYTKIHEHFLDKCAVLKTKKLMLSAATAVMIDTDALKDAGIDYIIYETPEEIEAIPEEELKEYCSYNIDPLLGAVNFYDLGTMKTIFSKYYVGGKTKIKKKDIKEIVAHF